MNNTTLFDAALHYHKLGKSVFPVRQDKKPFIAWREFQTRCASENEIKDWWKKYPDANIALPTGELNNLIVIDIDMRHKGSNELFKDLKTPYCITGNGWHYYFQYQEGMTNKAGFRQGYDLRGEGGFVIIPPSVHQSGKKYEWIISLEDITPIPLPDNLLQLIYSDQNQNNNKFDPLLLEGVSSGQRNQTAAQVAGKLLAHIPQEEWSTTAWSFFDAWNQRNNPPLPQTELKNVFSSIAQRERIKPKTISIPVTLEKDNEQSSITEDKTKGSVKPKSRLFHPALTIDIRNQVIITCFPKTIANFDKNKFRLEEAIIVVQSTGTYWELDNKEIKERKMYPLAIPSFGYSESRWSPQAMIKLKNERNCDHRDCRDHGTGQVVDPYTDVFLPIKEAVEYYVDFTNAYQSALITLWTIGTYLFPIFEAYPYLYLGGMRGSGKTKVLDTLQRLVFNPESTSNSSTASLFRTIERNLSTVLLDEGETLTGREVNPELRLLFNSGYKRSMSVVTRTQSDTFKTERFKLIRLIQH